MPLKKRYSVSAKPKVEQPVYANAVPFWKFWARHPNDIALSKRNPPGPKWGKDPLRVAGFSRKKKI
ncbi:MAG: hypothetical protein AABW59_03340 [archaeon]